MNTTITGMGAVLAVAASLAALACGGDDTTPGAGGGDSGDLALEDAAEAARDATCELFADCGFFADKETCIERTPTTAFDQLVASEKAGRTEYDPEAAGKCLASIEGLACTRGGLVGDEAACDAAAVGKVAEDGACFDDDECAGEAYCNREDCDFTASCCEGKCRPRAGADQDCGTFVECKKGFYCDPDAEKCFQPKATGSACTISEQCASGVCVGGACIVPAKTGEACDVTEPLDTCLRLDNYCNDKGLCEALPRAGEPCVQFRVGEVAIGLCALYAACVDDECVPAPSAGQDCAPETSIVRCETFTRCNETTNKCVAGEPAMVCE